MNLQQMIAVGVFLLVMAAIISEKVHRSVAALAGAVVLLLTHVLTIETAADYVDLNTIGVLVGMMLFVAVVKSSGLFEYIAIWSAKLTRGQPMAILAVFAVITAVLSAFLDNVTTVLLIGPMTATLIGDPPNIMIGSAAGLSFADFIVNTGPVVLIILAVVVAIFFLMYRGNLHVESENMEKVLTLDEKLTIKDASLLRKSVIMIVLVVVGFIFHAQLGIESATVALTAAGVMLLIGGQDAEDVILGVEWSTILFFIGLFVVVGGLNSTGVIAMLANGMLELVGDNEVLAIVLVLWASALISAFLDNIPFVATLIPMIQTMQQGGMDVLPLWWALSLGACLGGNGSLIGASANVVLAGVSAKNGYPITFMSYLKKGFPLMLLSVAICTVYLLIRFA